VIPAHGADAAKLIEDEIEADDATDEELEDTE